MFRKPGPQMLTNLILMVLFESMGYDCDLCYFIPNILAFLGTPSLSQNGQFGVFCYYS